MKSTDIETLNLRHLDVETVEQRLEMALLVHPFFYDCKTNGSTCNGHVSIE